jgi:hypothetical protein
VFLKPVGDLVHLEVRPELDDLLRLFLHVSLYSSLVNGNINLLPCSTS